MKKVLSLALGPGIGPAVPNFTVPYSVACSVLRSDVSCVDEKVHPAGTCQEINWARFNRISTFG
jgi:hypothetical protein